MHHNIRYLYLRNEPNLKAKEKRGFPIAVLAYSIYEEDLGNGKTEQRAAYGVATFNPKAPGVTYNAKFLRDIAVGRLIGEHKTVLLPDDFCQSMHEIMWVIVTNLLHDRDLPKRTQRAVKNWLMEARKYAEDEEQINSEAVNDSDGQLGIEPHDFSDKPRATIQQTG